MNVQELKRAVDLTREAENIEDCLDIVDSDRLGVTFEGAYQPPEIVAAARTGIIELLRDKHEKIVEELKKLGVEYWPNGAPDKTRTGTEPVN